MCLGYKFYYEKKGKDPVLVETIRVTPKLKCEVIGVRLDDGSINRLGNVNLLIKYPSAIKIRIPVVFLSKDELAKRFGVIPTRVT